MKKKIICTILSLCIAFVFTSCENDKNSFSNTSSDFSQSLGSTNSTDDKSHAFWTINDHINKIDFTEDIENIFYDATSKYNDYAFEPIMLLGMQVVAGINYAILCNSKSSDNNEAQLKVVVIYKDLKGNSTITAVNDFKIDDFNTGKIECNQSTNQFPMAGGWSINTDINPPILEGDVAILFKNALSKFSDAEYYPIAYLGEQKESLYKNHAIMCLRVSYSVNASSELDIVIINENTEGVCVAKSITPIDIAKYAYHD